MPTARSRPSRLLVLLVVATVALSVMPGLAAAEPRTGGTVVVEAGETTGSIEAFGGDVVVRGTVDGDLSGFAGSVRVAGTVTGSVSGAAGDVEIDGHVGGDVNVAGGHVSVGPDATIEGNLQAGAGTVHIFGRVLGDAKVGAGTIRLGPTARIEGDLEYDGTLERDEAAVVGGTVTRNPDLGVGVLPDISALVFSVYFFLVNLVVGLLLLFVFPRFSTGLAERTADRPGVTALAGIAALFGTPIALVLVGITIVGIPIALAGLLSYLLAVWAGSIYGRYVVGAWLLDLADYRNRWAALLVGMLAMVVVRRLPVVGGLLDFFVLLLGLGAVLLGLIRAYRGRGGAEADEAPEGGQPAGEGAAEAAPS